MKSSIINPAILDCFRSAILNSSSKAWAKKIAQELVSNNKSDIHTAKYIEGNDALQKKIYFECDPIRGLIAKRVHNDCEITNLLRLDRQSINYDEIKLLVPFYYNGKEMEIESLANTLQGNIGRCILDWKELDNMGILDIKNGSTLISQLNMFIILMTISRRYNIQYRTIEILWIASKNPISKLAYTSFIKWIVFSRKLKVENQEPISVVIYAMKKKRTLGA